MLGLVLGGGGIDFPLETREAFFQALVISREREPVKPTKHFRKQTSFPLNRWVCNLMFLEEIACSMLEYD